MKWLEYYQDKRILTDQKSIKKDFPDFKEHRHDQSILSLLYYKMPDGILAYNDRSDFIAHQRRDRKISLAWIVLKHKINKIYDGFLPLKYIKTFF